MAAATTQRLLQALPAIYQDDPFLGKFLQAFEDILLGTDQPPQPQQPPGLENEISRLATYFDPEQTPKDFLQWLSGWVALSLRDDWEEAAQRRFISRIVSLYQKRGTKAGLKELLRTYTDVDAGIDIVEFIQNGFEVGHQDGSIVGVNTFVGGAPPFYFQITMVLDTFNDELIDLKKQIARAIVDQEKPAHTYYDLEVAITHPMQVGVYSTIGRDTLLPP
jgi:phage tail-like protein